LGYSEDDAAYLDFNTFVKKFNVQYLPHNNQKISYDYHEKTRIKRIEEYLEEKRKLGEEQEYDSKNSISKDKV